MILNMSCAQCDAALQSDARFCENCGAAVAAVELPLATARQPPTSQYDAIPPVAAPQYQCGNPLRNGAFVFVIIGVLMGLWLYMNNDRTSSTQCAQDSVMFDNWNTAGCLMSDTAEFDLRETTIVTALDLWSNRSDLTASLLGPSGLVVALSAARVGDCDPNQSQWCEQQFLVHYQLLAGHYTLQVSQPSLCRNEASGGGFVRLHGCLLVH
jgi:hypothetical protein